MTLSKSDWQSQLLGWAADIERDLPWKESNDPYRIWISEIILQQTRVEQGRPYYLRFIERFPNVEILASADIDAVYQVWEGLGYYSRARNLHAAAQAIVSDWGGQLPDTYDGLLSLKGVGPYTAAAIGSFAYGLPQAVVDGNVMRVLTRVYGIREAIDASAGKRQVQELAQSLLVRESAAEYNQAIMDFGALQCVPKSPNCEDCVMAEGCVARAEGLVAELPYKAKRLKRKERYFHYLVLRHGARVVLGQRADKDVWRGLWEYVLIEKEDATPMNEGEIATALGWPIGACRLNAVKSPKAQLLTHQKISGVFYEIEVLQEGLPLPEGYVWLTEEEYMLRPMPRLLNDYRRLGVTM